MIVEAEDEADTDGAGGCYHVVIMLQCVLVEDAHRLLDGEGAVPVVGAVVEGEDANHLSQPTHAHVQPIAPAAYTALSFYLPRICVS